MGKFFGLLAVLITAALLALSDPAAAAQRTAGYSNTDLIEVSAARRHRVYRRHYWGPRYHRYSYGPRYYYYGPYYRRYHYRPYYYRRGPWLPFIGPLWW